MRGSSLLKLVSTKGCTATEMKEVTSYLLDPLTHSRATLLGTFATGSHEERVVALCALVSFILSQDPKEPAAAPWRPMSMRFIRNCAPGSMLRWCSHMQLREIDGHTESVRVSDYLWRVVCATEDLWELQGHLASREDA